MERYTWEARTISGDNLVSCGGPAYFDGLPAAIDQVKTAIEREWGNAPMYDGHPRTVQIRIEMVP